MTVLPIVKTIFKNLWREARFIENICEGFFFCVCVCVLSPLNGLSCICEFDKSYVIY